MVTAGIESSHVQTELNAVTIQTGNYLVFHGTGPMPATVVETWQRVWAFFEKDIEHRRKFISDFVAYSAPDQVAIYIGLE